MRWKEYALQFWLHNQLDIVLVCALAVLLYGFNMHWVGMHNLDLCRNEQVIEASMNQLLTEQGINLTYEISEVKLDGSSWSLDDCYVSGLKNMYAATFIMMIGAFSLGIGVYAARLSKKGK